MSIRIPTKKVWDILRQSYDIIPETVTKLEGYTHANYKVVIQSSKFEQAGSGEESYTMKLVDVSHSNYADNIDLQHTMLKHLHEHGIKASLPVTCIDGSTTVDYKFGGKYYQVQLLSFVDGVSLNDANIEKEDMTDVAFDMGRHLGQISNILPTMKYDIIKASAVHSAFHAENALVFEDKLVYVDNNHLRRFLQDYFEQFRRNVLPRLGNFRKGFIHSDFSDTNVIFKKEPWTGTTERLMWKIAGVIDVEDCCYGYFIGDIGICMAYVMMKAASIDADPIEASQHALLGYESVFKLLLPEKQALFDIVTSRLAVSYVSACYESFQNPDNTNFYFVQATNVPEVVEQIEHFGKSRVEDVWFSDRYQQCTRRKNFKPRPK